MKKKKKRNNSFYIIQGRKLSNTNSFIEYVIKQLLKGNDNVIKLSY